MFDIISLLFLLIASYQDEKTGKVGWFLILTFFLIALFIPNAWWQMAIAYAGCYILANCFDKQGMDFGGGDVKVLTVLAGLTGIWLTIGSLVVAMIIWRVLKYPNRVTFVSYILVGWLVTLFLQVKYLQLFTKF